MPSKTTATPTPVSPEASARPHAAERPEISVIIPSYNALRTISRCLTALRHQQDAPPFEVIVVDSSTDGTAELIAERYPEVRLLRPGRRMYPGDGRNYGIAHAGADIFAFVDADCVASPTWLASIARAHGAPDPVIGGGVDNANPASYVGWGYYFCEFSHWMPQGPHRLVSDAPTCCLSVKRWAYEKYGPFVEGKYCSDTDFNWKVAAAGHRPVFDPSIRVSHINPSSLRRFLGHEPMHGSAFAALRTRRHGISRVQRWARAAVSPLVPAVLWARTARRVWAHSDYFGKYLLATPIVILGFAAWSLGEARGYAFPSDD